MVDPSDGTNVNQLTLPQKYKNLFNGSDCSNPILININEQDTSFGNQEILNWSPNPNSDYFTSVFCHIATETMFIDKTLHLTEKSLRAFVNKRPMLLLGPPHSLSYLRSYGFKTWGDFWDESYDLIEDPWQRMEAVVDLIKKLNSMSLDDMEKMLDKMEPILDHNFQHFYNKFPDLIINELMVNMAAAISQSKSRRPNGWMLQRIEQLSEDELSELLNRQLIEEFPNSELYDGYKQGDMTKIDHNLARVLLLEMGFDKESSKEEILARLKIMFD